MTIVQLALLEPQKASRSTNRRPFTPSQENGPYKLPRGVQERLTTALAGFRNAEASYRLAVFLGRFWSTPSRINDPFPVDRRALEGRADLGLTESQVRGAIRTLEKVGFTARAIPAPGSQYRQKGDELHRKPILWTFGAEFVSAFIAANKRARVVQERRKLKDTRAIPPSSTTTMLMRLSMSNTATNSTMTNSPKGRIEAEAKVLMGDQKLREASAAEPDPRLEAALQRLGEAFRRKTVVPDGTGGA